MKKQTLPLLLSVLLVGKISMAQPAAVIKNYIEQYKSYAIDEMKRTGVPASITLAQGIHETSAGQSVLVKKSNNHFGIKCKSEWTGESVSHDDDAKGECFRKYTDPMDSYKDHSDFLRNRSHYAFLFSLDPTDYEAWARGLKKAGYATNPKYPQILIKLIEDYHLQDYTFIAMGRKAAEPAEVWASVKKSQMQDASVGSGPNPGTSSKLSSYPQGVFKINETPVVFVEKGTPYLLVAQQHRISLSRLFDFNDMEREESAAADGLIFLQRKRKGGATEFHKVAAGETLQQIAQVEGMRLESLLQYNMLNNNMQPAAGELLYLQRKAPISPRLATAQQNYISASAHTAFMEKVDAFVMHTVQPKETVYSIAKRHAVSMEDLIKWNELESQDLKTGQQLRINKKTTNATD